MAKLLRSGQIFYSWLPRIDFPGVEIKDDRPPLLVHFSHAKTGIGVRKQPKIAAAAERKPAPVHFQDAHGKFVKLFRNLVRAERRVRNAVIRMKTYREN